MFDWIEKRTIFKCISGSIGYGISTSLSDEDIRGICIAPREFYYGLHKFEQQEYKEPDTVIYSINKFVQLARDCNPNVLELLFSHPKNILFCDKWTKIG